MDNKIHENKEVENMRVVQYGTPPFNVILELFGNPVKTCRMIKSPYSAENYNEGIYSTQLFSKQYNYNNDQRVKNFRLANAAWLEASQKNSNILPIIKAWIKDILEFNELVTLLHRGSPYNVFANLVQSDYPIELFLKNIGIDYSKKNSSQGSLFSIGSEIDNEKRVIHPLNRLSRRLKDFDIDIYYLLGGSGKSPHYSPGGIEGIFLLAHQLPGLYDVHGNNEYESNQLSSTLFHEAVHAILHKRSEKGNDESLRIFRGFSTNNVDIIEEYYDYLNFFSFGELLAYTAQCIFSKDLSQAKDILEKTKKVLEFARDISKKEIILSFGVHRKEGGAMVQIRYVNSRCLFLELDENFFSEEEKSEILAQRDDENFSSGEEESEFLVPIGSEILAQRRNINLKELSKKNSDLKTKILDYTLRQIELLRSVVNDFLKFVSEMENETCDFANVTEIEKFLDSRMNKFKEILDPLDKDISDKLMIIFQEIKNIFIQQTTSKNDN